MSGIINGSTAVINDISFSKNRENITDVTQCLKYGAHTETKEPIAIDRKHADDYKTLMVCGTSGTGKQCGIEKEIRQILDEYTNDRVIISNAEFDHSKEKMKDFHPEYFKQMTPNRIQKETRGIFLDRGYHINILDIVYDAEKGIDLIKKCKQAVTFIEAVCFRKVEASLKSEDVNAIYHCVLSLLIPFAEELKKQCGDKGYAYDPVHNPKHADLMNALLDSHCSQEIKETIKAFREIPESKNNESPYEFTLNTLQRIVWDTEGTNIPDERCLELGFCSNWTSNAYPYIAPVLIASYADTIVDIGKYQHQTVWTYWDEAYTLIKRPNIITLIDEVTESHNNIRVAFELLSVNDFCLEEQYLKLFKNHHILWKFYSLCPLDRKLLPQVMQISEPVVKKYLCNEPAGTGVLVYGDMCIPFNERDKT